MLGLLHRRKAMSIIRENHLETIEIPANLRINDQIKRYREKCARIGCKRPYHHFAFGQSPFTPPAKIVDALKNIERYFTQVQQGKLPVHA